MKWVLRIEKNWAASRYKEFIYFTNCESEKLINLMPLDNYTSIPGKIACCELDTGTYFLLIELMGRGL